MITTISTLHLFAQSAGQRMVNCAIEGLLIALLTHLAIRLMPRTNSGTRFAIWLAALFLIVALPLMGMSGGASGWTPSLAAQLTLPMSWAVYAFIAWGLFASLGLARVAIGLWRVCQLRRNATEVDISALDPRCQKTLADFKSIRQVKVCVSHELRVPAAAGFFRPSVLIPNWALEDLSPGELNAVLMHELGHLRRWDDWTNLLERILGALLFFHPAVWWINSRLSLEREMACDDLVLAEMADARAYAECLVSVSEKSLLRDGLALALAAVSRVRQTAVRLAKILDRNRPNGTRVSRPAVAMMMVVGGAALAAAPYVPPIVEFHDRARPQLPSAQLVQQTPILPVQFSSRTGPKLIQAAADGNSLTAVATVFRTKGVAPGRGSRSDQTMQARSLVRRKPASDVRRLVRASRNQQVAPRVLLVVESQGYSAAGVPVWSLCVWQITLVPNQGQAQVRSDVVSKSI
jgi:beta-lactamase regulating signal transducer with metallopeptidase domain